METLIPLCYGRLHLTTEEMENLCVCEVEAMLEGWKVRYKDLQTLFAAYCAMPVINAFSKTPVKLEDLVKDEKNPDDLSGLTDDELAELAEE